MLIGGLLLLAFVSYFFMPFSRWNGLATGSLLIAHLFYLFKAFHLPARRSNKIRSEMAVYAIVLMLILAVLTSKKIPLFAWVFLLGTIINLWVRVLYLPHKKEPDQDL